MFGLALPSRPHAATFRRYHLGHWRCRWPSSSFQVEDHRRRERWGRDRSNPWRLREFRGIPAEWIFLGQRQWRLLGHSDQLGGRTATRDHILLSRYVRLLAYRRGDQAHGKILLTHQAPANRWSLFSHMVYVRLSVRKTKRHYTFKTKHATTLKKTKSPDNGPWGLVDH